MSAIASSETVKENNILICMISEYANNNKEAFDCNVQRVIGEGVHVIYLSGYRSRNDFVPWEDIVAKVDKRKPIISVADNAFKGHFIEFKARVKENT